MGYEICCCLLSGTSDGNYMDNMGKTNKVNFQDVTITFPFDELIKCLLDDKALGCTAKHLAHPKHLEDMHWSLNSNVFPDI